MQKPKPVCALLILLISILSCNVTAQQQLLNNDSEQTEIIILEDDLSIPAEHETTIEFEDSSPETLILNPEDSSAITTTEKQPLTLSTNKQYDFGIDELRIEAAALTTNSHTVDTINYTHAAFSGDWYLSDNWTAKLAARLDAYQQTGNPNWDTIELDYGDNYVTYRGANYQVSAGTQTVIWGRIDEVPPTDRLSTQDLNRFILDDLHERRRSRSMIRIEHFQDTGKLDLFYLPIFRESELPDTDSIWYPIDQERGLLLGIENDPTLSSIIKTANISTTAPSNDGGFGMRYTHTETDFDYGVTLQHGRQTNPYFSYDTSSNTLKAQYPRFWSFGGDIGFEANGATWRIEASYISDIPVTTTSYEYTQVEGINWATGVEFFPGDEDLRVNLQLTGLNLFNTPKLLDRDKIYNFNGSIESPFASQQWKAKLRFSMGLDKKDFYINPEITFIGWEPHELYLELHYFDGEDGTLGGFHEHHSLVTAGWRAKF